VSAPGAKKVLPKEKKSLAWILGILKEKPFEKIF
jgi:hypothetical protein